MKIEVLDLSGVGSGWKIEDYNSSEKDKMEKENIFFTFTEKELIDFAELQASISCEYEGFTDVNEAIEYLEVIGYSVKINR